MRTFIARLILAAGCSALTLFSAPALSLYAMPAAKRVPVARLIANLQGVVDKNPDNVRAVLNLARAHAMAYDLILHPGQAALCGCRLTRAVL